MINNNMDYDSGQHKLDNFIEMHCTDLRITKNKLIQKHFQLYRTKVKINSDLVNICESYDCSSLDNLSLPIRKEDFKQIITDCQALNPKIYFSIIKVRACQHNNAECQICKNVMSQLRKLMIEYFCEETAGISEMYVE
jgi:hypothetical protein